MNKEFLQGRVLKSIVLHRANNWQSGEMNLWFICGEVRAVKHQVTLVYDAQTNTLVTEGLPLKLSFTEYHYDLDLDNGETNNVGLIELCFEVTEERLLLIVNRL